MKHSRRTFLFTSASAVAAVGNVDIVEGIPGTASGMDYRNYRLADGKLVIPDVPGFGIKLQF